MISGGHADKPLGVPTVRHLHAVLRKASSLIGGASELGAAYRNRTDDLRITRRMQLVQDRPPGHSRPACRVPVAIPVHGRPVLLLADPLARLPRARRSGVGKYGPIVGQLALQPGIGRGRLDSPAQLPDSFSIVWTAVKEAAVGSSSALSHIHSDFSWSGGQPVAARTASR